MYRLRRLRPVLCQSRQPGQRGEGRGAVRTLAAVSDETTRATSRHNPKRPDGGVAPPLAACYGPPMLEPYLRQWALVANGDLIVTRTSQLLPVLSHGQPAMLKVTGDADERHGRLLMRWWPGREPLGCFLMIVQYPERSPTLGTCRKNLDSSRDDQDG